MSVSSGAAATAAAQTLARAQEHNAALLGAAFDAARIRYASVDPKGDPRFFAGLAFTSPDGTTPVVTMDIKKSASDIPQHTHDQVARGLAAFADALRLCPDVTESPGYLAVARFGTGTGSAGARVPGVAVTYDQQSDVPTTVFFPIAGTAGRAELAERIYSSAPLFAEPGFATPKRRGATDEERAEYVRRMSLAPDGKAATTKRARRTLAL